MFHKTKLDFTYRFPKSFQRLMGKLILVFVVLIIWVRNRDNYCFLGISTLPTMEIFMARVFQGCKKRDPF